MQGEALQKEKQPCSFADYIGQRKTPWVFPEEILSYFSKSNPSLSYQSFVTDNQNEEEINILDKVTLEN